MASWFHSLFAGLLQRRLGSRRSPHGDGRGCVTAECAAILVRPPVWRVSMPVPALRRAKWIKLHTHVTDRTDVSSQSGHDCSRRGKGQRGLNQFQRF